MEKYITFKEKELEYTLSRLNKYINDIDFEVKLMQEQVQGKRTNISLEDSSRMIFPISEIKELIKSFK